MTGSADFCLPDSETTEDEGEEPVETKEDEAEVQDQVVHTGTQHLLDSLSDCLAASFMSVFACVLQ